MEKQDLKSLLENIIYHLLAEDAPRDYPVPDADWPRDKNGHLIDWPWPNNDNPPGWVLPNDRTPPVWTPDWIPDRGEWGPRPWWWPFGSAWPPVIRPLDPFYERRPFPSINPWRLITPFLPPDNRPDIRNMGVPDNQAD